MGGERMVCRKETMVLCARNKELPAGCSLRRGWLWCGKPSWLDSQWRQCCDCPVVVRGLPERAGAGKRSALSDVWVGVKAGMHDAHGFDRFFGQVAVACSHRRR